MILSSWGVTSPLCENGVEVPEDDVGEYSRLEKKTWFGQILRSSVVLMTSLHQFLDLALIVTHDGLKVSRFQDDTTSDQNNVVAAGQERNTVCDKDPSLGRKQSARADDMIYEESITRKTSTKVRCRLTVNMTCNVGINSG